MANLPETITWETGIYQLETTDPVLGGPDGIDNLQAKQLANRTRYLKQHVDNLESGATVPPGIATQTWVNDILEGRDWKQSVRAATTANISLTGAQTIDGVSVTTGDRVLVKNQNTASQNGIYVVSASAWTRAIDADESTDVTAGLTVFVSEGTLQADTIWKLTTNDPIALDTTALSFANITAGYATIDSPSLTGDPTCPTAAQFDNDQSLANTAFVRRAAGSLAGSVALAASTVLDASYVGKRVNLGAGVQATLPTPGSVPVGSAILISVSNSVTDATIAVSGGGSLAVSGVTQATPYTMGQGCDIYFVSDGTNTWFGQLGMENIRKSPLFSSLLAVSGYKKIGDLIFQFCNANPTASADASVSFPITFPNAALHIVSSAGFTNAGVMVDFNSLTTSGVKIAAWSANATRVAATCSVIAIGY